MFPLIANGIRGPPLSDAGALDSSSALSSGMASCTGMISGCRLISLMAVGGAFLTGLATTVDGIGCGGLTTSFTWGEHTMEAKEVYHCQSSWFSICVVDCVTKHVLLDVFCSIAPKHLGFS